MDGQENQLEDGANSGSAAEARIAELTAKVAALTDTLNARETLSAQERERQEEAQCMAAQNQGIDPNSDDVKVWGPWMQPKIQQFLAPRDQVLIKMAEELDELKTMQKFPEYGDEEFKSRVDKYRRDTQRTRGIVLSRAEAITQLKGDDYLAGRISEEEYRSRYQGNNTGGQVQQSAPAVAPRQITSPVEARGGLQTNRAAAPSRSNKNPEDMSIEEFESQYGDLPV